MKWFTSLALIVLSASAIFGQANSLSPQMFAGEVLKYEGKASKLRLSISVADMTFTATSAPGSDDLVIKSEAVSKGTLLKLFRFSFLQRYESIVDINKFRILKTTKHDVQKERIRDSEAVFDYKKRQVTFVETDPGDRTRPPRRIASEIGEKMHDIISSIYAVRLMPLAVGKRYEFSVSDSGLVYKVPFVVTKREVQKTVAGKNWCWRVEPDIFGPGKLIEQKGKMVIWMTDDARHLPVKAELETGFGKVDIKLKSYSKSVLGFTDRP